MNEQEAKLILYTSNSCPHAWAVERFFTDYEIEATKINIDKEEGARESLTALNGGYASVPTIIFPDGEKMIEPSFSQLRNKLGIESDGIWGSIRSWFS